MQSFLPRPGVDPSAGNLLLSHSSTVLFRKVRWGVVKLKDFFDQRAIRGITPMLIEKFKSELRKFNSRYKRPFSPATVNRYLHVLSRVLSMAYENGIVDGNPMSRVKRLREPAPRQPYLNQYLDDEEERLMKALATCGEHMVALAELDLEVGMRLSELLNTNSSDVDETNSSPSRRPRTTSRV